MTSTQQLLRKSDETMNARDRADISGAETWDSFQLLIHTLFWVPCLTKTVNWASVSVGVSLFITSSQASTKAGWTPEGPINGKLHRGVNTWLEWRWTYLAQHVTRGRCTTTASDSISYLFSLPWKHPGLPPTWGTLFLSLYGARSSAALTEGGKRFSRCPPLGCSQSPSLLAVLVNFCPLLSLVSHQTPGNYEKALRKLQCTLEWGH